MEFHEHVRTTGSALKNWFVAQCYDSAAVAALWLVGLTLIGVPWAPLWALLAGVLQFIPWFGQTIAMIFPALVGLFSSNHMRFFYVLILYVVVMVADGVVDSVLVGAVSGAATVGDWVRLLAQA